MTLDTNHSAAHRPSALRVVIAFGTVYLVWGSTYLAIKLVSQHGAFVLAGSRFLCAAILLFAIACWQGVVRRSDFTVKSWSNAAVVGCCLMLIGNGGVAIATNTVDSGVVALMTAITPLWLVGLEAAPEGILTAGEGEETISNVTVATGRSGNRGQRRVRMALLIAA